MQLLGLGPARYHVSALQPRPYPASLVATTDPSFILRGNPALPKGNVSASLPRPQWASLDMTRRLRRIDNFGGTDSQYIAYLEYEIVQLRNHVHSTTTSQQQGTVSRSPPNFRHHFDLQERQVLPQQTESNDELEVVIWQPGKPPHRAMTAAVEVLPSRMNSFFRDIPFSEEQWKQKRQLLDLTSPDGLFRAFDDLTLLSPTWDR